MEKGNYYHIEAPRGLYRPLYEHDACGTGFIARISGEPSHDLVQKAVEAVINLTHRGAVSADAKTGDGAGVLTQVPRKLFTREAERLGLPLSNPEELAVAMVFLPQSDSGQHDRAMQIVEEAVTHYAMTFLGWRQVPTDPSVLGEQGLSTLPDIRQGLILPGQQMTGDGYERTLYLARKRAEKEAAGEGIQDFHIPSMSHRTIVYKGLFVAPQLKGFYKDLVDPDYESALALFHQRYATNTFPDWFRAQPLRFLAHNGEINTLQGNRNWLRAREPEMVSELWGDEIETLKPVTSNDLSDSGSLDNALELLTLSGRSVLHSMMMLIPEAWENMPNMDPAWRAFYEYHASLAEPWDGPAAITFTDGVIAAAVLDRNGLRPARYKVTADGLMIMASEVGVLDIPDDQVVEKGRLGPGQMIAVDTANKKLLYNKEIKDEISHLQPYGQWVESQRKRYGHTEQVVSISTNGVEPIPLLQLQKAFGYTNEEPTMVIKPMVVEGKDATYSMGDDTPLALFSHVRPILYNYFKQKFAQVTNPAIDNLREFVVMSGYTYLGARGSLLEEKESAARLIQLPGPILLDHEVKALQQEADPSFQAVTLPAVFHVGDGPDGLRKALETLCQQAEEAIDDGKTILILSDRNVDEEHAPIPMLLAVGGLHHHLIDRGKRMRASIVAETGEPRDVHHFAALIGYGASAVSPYMALDIVSELIEKGEIKEVESDEYAREKYRASAEKGVLKIMSKMGISTVTSYHGAQIFEILGLKDEVVDRCFRDTPSQIGGLGFQEIAEDVLGRHQKAFSEPVTPKSRLEDIGFIRFRRSGEFHANNPKAVRALHEAVRSGDYADYKVYSDMMSERPPTSVRDLLTFTSDRSPIPIEEVEPKEEIFKRFITSAMSFGALSPEAHETLAKAMNFIGGASSTGEGGEHPNRFRQLTPDGYNANTKIKQVASARFGVTPEYLAMADELEIKMAQGSKPGEGGQLPGHKVVEHIAVIRHSQPGITLISPPPHHDIYSIEDLAQLIYDLKVVNPRARVEVKLVSEAGVGTIAAGVAKGYADSILISGHSGGTGASPLSSIKNAGNPWELGLAEAQQVLVMNNLRGRIRLRTDGGFHVGSDVVMAAMLGADQFGFGTVSLIAMGCEMARQCHLNTCPVGVATQRDDLRAKFNGTVETVVNYFTFVAEEVRGILAELGYRSIEELVGRTDLLAPRTDLPQEERARFMDPRPLLAKADPTGTLPVKNVQARNDRDDPPLDDEILSDIWPLIERGESVKRTYEVRNVHRTVGGRVSGEIAHVYGNAGLPPGTVDLEFHGTAGQSFGAWTVNGVRLTLVGEANDYVGKGMGGGEVVLKPHENARFAAHENAIMGNTCLYGATGGYFFAAGQAGERFCVRASGVRAVVEGVGDHGCEYMTSGVAVILGATGRNFGAGMSGGMAFVYDPQREFPRNYNPDLLSLDPLEDDEDVAIVKDLIQRHTEATGSERGAEILANWDVAIKDFWKVIPFQIKDKGLSLADVLKKVEGAVTVVR